MFQLAAPSAARGAVGPSPLVGRNSRDHFAVRPVTSFVRSYGGLRKPIRTSRLQLRATGGDYQSRNVTPVDGRLKTQSLLHASTALWLLSESAAHAEGEPGYSIASYSVSLGLFVMTVPGLWSLIKRAPKAAVKARVYAVDGPGKPGAMPIDDRAREIFAYFKKYNYRVVDTGEVITFEGTYTSNKGQAASLVFYTFVSLLCCGLVLTIVAPWGGNWWYGLSALSPLAGAYYLERGERVEQVKVKMVTSDDDSEVDITVQGDPEELDRLSKELGLMEKGKVYVKGLLEQ
mmetsp:Transcript_28514/g.50939  ORF Transcript_28514/g.50939 Transcript_28514/m.50939 type:complete len:289 (-) Transcript_28514:346-1212(-)